MRASPFPLRSVLKASVMVLGVLVPSAPAQVPREPAPTPTRAQSASSGPALTEGRVIRESAQEITVDLLTRSTDGVLTHVARGALPPDAVSVIPIVGGPNAWVRFSTPDRAPLTVRAADLQAPEEWRLPELRAGGELFLTVEASPLPPLFYQLSGPFLADLRVRDLSATFHGLPPGTYELTPVYDGPIKGEPLPVAIHPAQTTAMLVKREKVGAAVLTAAHDICSAAETFVLDARLVMNTRGQPTRGELINSHDVAPCRWRVGGLAPGLYEAVLRAGRSLSGRVQFEVAADKTTEAAIDPPRVTVSGLVTVNDKPLPNAMIQFLRPPRTTTLQVRPDGSYEIALDEEGEYSVTMRAAGQSIVRRATLVRGPNTLDFVTKDPSFETELTIRVSGGDPSVKIDIDIRSTDGANLVSATIAPGETSAVRRALSFGTHRVTARQPGAASELQLVELSRDRLTTTVDLSLTRSNRSLTLRYGDGEPVSHASFSNVFAPPEEIAPGMYSLATIATGTELVIKPPLGAPLCRIVHAHGDVHAVVDAGRALTLQFEDPRVTADNVRIATGSTSDCPVPLGRFLKTSFSAGPERSRRVELLNAPSEHVLTIYTPGGAQQVQIGLDGLVIVPSSR